MGLDLDTHRSKISLGGMLLSSAMLLAGLVLLLASYSGTRQVYTWQQVVFDLGQMNSRLASFNLDTASEYSRGEVLIARLQEPTSGWINAGFEDLNSAKNSLLQSWRREFPNAHALRESPVGGAAVERTAMSQSMDDLFESVVQSSSSLPVLRAISDAKVATQKVVWMLSEQRQSVVLREDVGLAITQLGRVSKALEAVFETAGVLHSYQVRQLLGQFVSRVEALQLSAVTTAEDRVTSVNFVQALEDFSAKLAFEWHGQYRRSLWALLLCSLAVLLGSLCGWWTWKSLRGSGEQLGRMQESESAVVLATLGAATARLATGQLDLQFRSVNSHDRQLVNSLNEVVALLRHAEHDGVALAATRQRHAEELKTVRQHAHRVAERQEDVGRALVETLVLFEAIAEKGNAARALHGVTNELKLSVSKLESESSSQPVTEVGQVFVESHKRLAAIDSSLSAAIDQMVGVRVEAEQSAMLALNASLRVSPDIAPQDGSSSLVQQGHELAQQTQNEVTAIEKQLRAVRDDIHLTERLIEQEFLSAAQSGLSASELCLRSLQAAIDSLAAVCESLEVYAKDKASLESSLRGLLARLQQRPAKAHQPDRCLVGNVVEVKRSSRDATQDSAARRTVVSEEI